MFYFLRKWVQVKVKLLLHRKISENDILNVAMNLTLEWGKNWLSPVDDRLKGFFPNIGDDKAKRIDTYIKETRNDIFNIIEQYYLKELSDTQMKLKIKDKYPFMNNDNYTRLLSQGMYYAWKDNG